MALDEATKAYLRLQELVVLLLLLTSNLFFL
jgi:hypothetical protein